MDEIGHTMPQLAMHEDFFREVKLVGHLVITIYPAQRRWWGGKKSLIILETRVELPNANPEGESKVEMVHTILKGWILPQPTYTEHRIPANILEHAP